MNEKNPYASPTINQLSGISHGRSGTWVRQVRVVAILMIVLGFLELLFGGYLFALSFFMPRLMSQQMAQQPNQIPAEQLEMVNRIMFVYCGIGGAVAVFISLIRIVAGVFGLMFRGRILGIISHFLGLLLIFTVYCVPTGVALFVYGCIVYFNREVGQAFKMRKQGMSVAEILAQFH